MDLEFANSPRVLVSLIIAILLYVGKYYYTFHQLCPAMWAGTYPIFFIGIATPTIYKFLSIPETIKRGQERRAEKEDAEYKEFLEQTRNSSSIQIHENRPEQENSNPVHTPPPRIYW